MADFDYVSSPEYDEHIKQQNLQDDGSGPGVPAFDPLTNRYPALKEQIGQWRAQGMSDADIDNGLAEQERELRLSGKKTPADLDAMFGRTEFSRGLDKTWLLHNKVSAIAQITGESEADVKARTIDAFKLGIPVSTAIEYPEIHKRLVGEYGTRMESNPLSAFWNGMVGEARNSEQAELLGGYIKKLATGPLSPEDRLKLVADMGTYQKRLAMQQSVEPDGFLAYIAKNAGELAGQQFPGIGAGLKKYGLPLLGAGLALALAAPTGGLSVAGGSALAGTAAVATSGLLGAVATASGVGGAYEDMMNREALETFLELMQDPKNRTPEGQVQAARLAMAKGMINAYIELGTLGNIGRMLNIPGVKSIGLLPEKIKSAFTRFLGSPAALSSPTAANFLKRYAGTYLKNVSAESFEEAEQAFVGDAFVNFSRHLNGDLSLAEAMGNLFSREELRSLGLVYGQSAESFAAGMLPGGLARAGAGLLGLHAYNKSPQGKAHKALAERLELEGNGDVVFLPREVLQSFGQSEAPAGGEVSSSAAGMEKALGVTDTDVVKSTKEVMIDREKYERAARENPTFRAAAEAYVRYGSEGRTFSETAAEIRDNVSDPINAETPFARSARVVRDRKIQALKDAGADDRTAEAGGYIWAKSVLRRAYNLGENEFGVLRDDALTPEQLDNLNVRGGQAEEAFGGDVYGQPMNAGVDLNQEVTGVVVTPTLADDDIPLVKTSGEVRKSFFDKIAGKYLNTDTQWEIFLSKKNIDHAIHTAMDTAKKNVHNLGFAIRFEDIVKILEGLPQIVQNAKLIESHEDRHKNPDVKQIHRMYCPVKLTTDPDVYHVVKLTVKELKSGYEATIAGIYRGYDAKVEQTRKKASDVHRTPQRSDTSNTSGAFSVSIGDMLDQVKDNDGNLYFQSAWHGSPHRFESFDLGAVGSGEGGQAHGWGLYFARDKKIAEGYRAKLESEGNGALFEVDVPENDMLLDEDKLLPEQPEKVREAISKYYRSRPDDYIAVDSDSLPEQNGKLFLKEVIRQLAREGEPEPKKAASLLLNSLGIKGITYDGSRDGRCFVVFDDKAVSVIERYNQEVTGQPLVRQGLTRKPDSAQAKVVHLPEKAVPQFPKIQDFNKWVKALLMNDGNPPVKILSTGQEATFTGRNIRSSLKRARSEAHREAYAALRQMISLAEYDRFEPADAKHLHLRGQDIYYSALSMGDRLYSVRLKLDVPPAGDKGDGRAVYKDHRLTEITIAPALYSTEFGGNQSRTQEAGAISTVSLGVLRGNVKPSNLEGGHLQQKHRGQIQIGSHGEGLITLFKHADRSTFFHEMGHMMLDDLITDGLLEKTNARTKADLDAVRAYLDIGDMDLSKRLAFTGTEKERYVEAQERFARSFEAYLMEGKAPTRPMRGVFARIRRWLVDVYHDLSRLDVELSPEVREVFDHLLMTPDEIDARKTVNDLALEESLLKQRIEELEGMEKLLPDPGDMYDEGYDVGYKAGVKEGVKTGRKRERDARRARLQALKAAQAKKLAERKEINSAAKYFKGAVRMKSLSWHMQQAIRQKLEGYTFKRFNKKRLEASRELLEYIKQTPEAELNHMDAADRRYIRMIERTTLNDMTLEDVRALRQEIENMVSRGREEFERWETERNSRREKWFSALAGDLHKTEQGKGADGIVTNSADIGKQYDGVRGKAAKVKDWVYANTLGANRFFDWLGGGAGDYRSFWTRLFVDEVNRAFDAELRYVQSRHLAMEEKMKELGITAADLNKKVRIRGGAYSKDMLLHVYAGLQNENSRAAILYGNMRATWLKEGEAGVQRLAAECVGALSENEKKLAQAVMRDFDENFARINDACIDAYNMGMEQEKNYTPMSRLEFAGQSLNNLFNIDEAAMMKGRQQTAGAARARVEKGFMQERIKDLAPENQKPIELGLMSVWHDQVETQEHTAAYAKLAGDLHSVLMKRDKATGRTLGAEINDRFGHDAVANLREYANIVIQGQNVTANAVMNGVSSYFGRNMAVAYLCLNFGTVLKQLTSIPRFLISATPGHLMSAIAQFATHPEAMLEKVYELDPQMRNRAPDAFMNVLRGAKAKETSAVKLKYLDALETMMKPISYADRLVSSIGWWATYQSNIKNGLSKEAAVREAQRAVALTQQTPLAKDMPRLWNQQGVARLMMIFTSDMANTWGMTVYDLAHTKGGRKLLSTVTALSMTAALMGFAEGGPDDDDDWILWMMNKFADQQISAAPLVGKEIMSALNVFMGDGYNQATYSSLAAPFVKLMQGVGGMSAADSGKVYSDGSTKFERSMFKALEGVSLLTPFPFTAANRIRRIVRADDAGEAARVLFGMRIRKK